MQKVCFRASRAANPMPPSDQHMYMFGRQAMKEFAKSILFVGVLGTMLGCATIATRHSKGPFRETRPATYPATRVDLAFMAGFDPLSAGSSECRPTFLYFFGGLVDLPFSLLTDTVCLPVDLYRARHFPGERAEKTDEGP